MKAVAAIAAFVAFAQDGKNARPPEQGPGPEVGKEAPAWKLRSQDGKIEVDLSKLRGKPVLLIFGSYT